MFFEKIKSVESYNIFLEKRKNRHTLFVVLEPKRVNIVLEQKKDKIKRLINNIYQQNRISVPMQQKKKQ